MSDPERVAAIAWIQQKIQEYALTPDDIGPFSTPGDPLPPAAESRPKTLYLSADGKSWDGDGDMPEWLRRAVAAGQSPEHFRVGN